MRTRVAALVASTCVVVALAGCSSSSSASKSGAVGPKKRVVPEITVTSAQSGQGVRPILAWKAVSDAAKYRVVVLDANTHPYWAWEGTTTSVPVGGGKKPAHKGSAGPRVGAGFSWSVAALDAKGKPIALSDRWPVAP